VRLFDVLRGTHWTLLGYVCDRSNIPSRAGLRVHIIGPAGDLHDVEGHFVEAYGVQPGEWLLIRPDGYVAVVVDTSRIEMLEAHCGKHLPGWTALHHARDRLRVPDRGAPYSFEGSLDP
jgi:hypothetical protein